MPTVMGVLPLPAIVQNTTNLPPHSLPTLLVAGISPSLPSKVSATKALEAGNAALTSYKHALTSSQQAAPSHSTAKV